MPCWLRLLLRVYYLRRRKIDRLPLRNLSIDKKEYLCVRCVLYSRLSNVMFWFDAVYHKSGRELWKHCELFMWICAHNSAISNGNSISCHAVDFIRSSCVTNRTIAHAISSTKNICICIIKLFQLKNRYYSYMPLRIMNYFQPPENDNGIRLKTIFPM